MKKNNNKGYLLAETIIVLTVVATAITIIYASIMNYFINENQNTIKYNTAGGLYASREVKKYYDRNFINLLDSLGDNDYLDITTSTQRLCTLLDIKTLYFSKYNISNELIDETPNFLKSELKKEEYRNSKCKYRFLLIMNDDSFSTIGVECGN